MQKFIDIKNNLRKKALKAIDDTKFYPRVVEAIFGDEENLDHVFALKLAIFELDGIKDSKKEELKEFENWPRLPD